MTVDEAKKVLMEDEKRKQEACLQEVDAVLKKHGYRLQIQSSYILVPNPQVMEDGKCISE